MEVEIAAACSVAVTAAEEAVVDLAVVQVVARVAVGKEGAVMGAVNRL